MLDGPGARPARRPRSPPPPASGRTASASQAVAPALGGAWAALPAFPDLARTLGSALDPDGRLTDRASPRLRDPPPPDPRAAGRPPGPGRAPPRPPRRPARAPGAVRHAPQRALRHPRAGRRPARGARHHPRPLAERRDGVRRARGDDPAQQRADAALPRGAGRGAARPRRADRRACGERCRRSASSWRGSARSTSSSPAPRSRSDSTPPSPRSTVGGDLELRRGPASAPGGPAVERRIGRRDVVADRPPRARRPARPRPQRSERRRQDGRARDRRAPRPDGPGRLPHPGRAGQPHPAHRPGAGGDRRRAEPGPGPLDVLVVRAPGAGDPARSPARARSCSSTSSGPAPIPPRAPRSAPRSSRRSSTAARASIATTHLEPLKVFAQVEPRLENATVAFDAERLEPTFRLEYGHPGPSYALTIGERLGLPAGRHRPGPRCTSASETRRLETLLATLEARTRDAAARSAEAARREAEAVTALAAATAAAERARAEARELRRAAEQEAQALLAEARRRVGQELDRLKTDEAGRRRAAQEAYRQLRAAEAIAPAGADRGRPGRRSPGEVQLRGLGLRGRIVAEADGQVTVQAGHLTVRVARSEIEPATARTARAGAAPSPCPSARTCRASSTSSGSRRTRRAWRSRSSSTTPSLAGHREIRLIHGKGTGAAPARGGRLSPGPSPGRELPPRGAGGRRRRRDGRGPRGRRGGRRPRAPPGARRPLGAEGQPVKVPPEVLDEIRARVDLVDLVGAVVPLKRAGERWKGLCPFHQEKTPSFTVNPKLRIFHCFGCHAGGDAFEFLRRHDRLDFPEAVRLLAERAGVALPGPRGDARGRRPRRAPPGHGVGRPPLRAPAVGRARRGARPRRISTGAGIAPRDGAALPARLRARGLGPPPRRRARRRASRSRRSSAPGSCIPRQNGAGHYDRFRGPAHLPDRGHAGARHRVRRPRPSPARSRST